SGKEWLQLPAKKPLFIFRGRNYPEYYKSDSPIPPVQPYSLTLPGERVVTVEMLNEERERKMREEKEIEEKLSKMKRELGIGSSEQAPAQEEKQEEAPATKNRIIELEKLLTESMKQNIKLEMERDRALEKYNRLKKQMKDVLDQAE
ncbi:hypothetical protein PMAYCL1PPCAC_22822, partial [Pristionchus mayeri]